MSDTESTFRIVKIAVVIVLAIGAVISLIIVKSFGYLDYYQLGLKRQLSTGTVDKTKIYTGGRYLIGPDFEFKTFKADVHFVDIIDAKSFTADKLEVAITAHFQYVIRANELVALHDAYDIDYKDTVQTSALDALKGAVTFYNVRELINNRSDIEKATFKTVRERLGGICCNYLCGKTNPMCSSCITVCTQEDRGLNVEVKFFQLAEIEIPDDVNNQFIKALLAQERAQEEILKQEAVIVRKATVQMVELVKNAAEEIKETATAKGELIATMSKANYTVALETARSEGLKSVYTALAFTEQGHKNSFDYLRTMRGQKNAHITIGFQQKIAGTL